LEKFKSIIKTVILCGRQNLSLRSHEDYGVFDTKIEPNKNEGNFRAILRARIESGDEHLRKHFETCGKLVSKRLYTSFKVSVHIPK